MIDILIIEKILLYAAFIFYSVFFITGLINKKFNFFIIFYTGLFFHIFCIILRTLAVFAPPFTNLYESLVFFSFLYIVKLLISKLIFKNVLLAAPGILLILIACILPDSYKIYKDLMPSLNSFWIIIHIPGFFIGYVSLTFAFVMTIIEIIFKRNLFEIINNEIKMSFFFITLGIITGAFWAQVSWGRFWSWDPKEIWALITWLILVLFFHNNNYKIKFILVILAFLSMLFTYFGVMFLLPGLHSYL